MGVAQNSATYRIVAQPLFIEIKLPPKSQLWSVLLNGTPAKPQHKEGKTLIDLTSETDKKISELKIVYETPIPKLSLWDTIELEAPKLYPHNDSQLTAIPTMEVDWSVHMPSGFWVINSSGDVQTNAIIPAELALFRAARLGFYYSGGLVPKYGLLPGFFLPALNSAREKARRISCASNLKQIGLGIKQYTMDFNDMLPNNFSELAKNDYLTDKNLFICPSCTKSNGGADNSSYTYCGKGLNEATSPSDTIIVYCGKCHNNYANFLFMDGHVKGYAGDGLDGIIRANNFYVPNYNAVTKSSKVPIWAVEGARSLTISLASMGPAIRFKSISTSPKLSITLLNDRKINFSTISAMLLTIVIGLGLTV